MNFSTLKASGSSKRKCKWIDAMVFEKSLAIAGYNEELHFLKMSNVGHSPLWPEDQYAHARTKRQSTRKEEEATQESNP